MIRRLQEAPELTSGRRRNGEMNKRKQASSWLKDKLGVTYKAKTISKRAERIATNVAKPKVRASPKKVVQQVEQSDNYKKIKELWITLTAKEQDDFWTWTIFKSGLNVFRQLTKMLQESERKLAEYRIKEEENKRRKNH